MIDVLITVCAILALPIIVVRCIIEDRRNKAIRAESKLIASKNLEYMARGDDTNRASHLITKANSNKSLKEIDDFTNGSVTRALGGNYDKVWDMEKKMEPGANREKLIRSLILSMSGGVATDVSLHGLPIENYWQVNICKEIENNIRNTGKYIRFVKYTAGGKRVLMPDFALYKHELENTERMW